MTSLIAKSNSDVQGAGKFSFSLPSFLPQGNYFCIS